MDTELGDRVPPEEIQLGKHYVFKPSARRPPFRGRVVFLNDISVVAEPYPEDRDRATANRVSMDRRNPLTGVFRSPFARNLAMVNTKAKLPIELLGEVMKYEVPNARPGPHPGSKYAGTRRKKKVRGSTKRNRFT